MFAADRVGALTVFLRVMRPELLTEGILSILSGSITQGSTVKVPSYVPDGYKEKFGAFIDVLTDE